MLVKHGRSQLKKYGCLFTCLNTRAVHIEILASLDTDSLINGLRRFICRRGVPEKIRSNNGTNFVGADRELKRAIEDWNQKKIETFLKQHGIQWVVNTPTASHHGGVWQPMVRSVRKALMITKEQVLTDESLATLMCEAEAIVNSRPITTVSDDVRDLEALTPSQLILLRNGSRLPPGEFHTKDVYRRRWRQVQYLANIFWKRWTKEYLPLLQERTKWK